ncbi:unnamed protein product [Dimorphilus gyrociliatus]|uniref:Uncharacterized protein n=1 Tax=Dimorphilus gyrociliatus TaxID=2664684 RepID=A0A7I8VAM8_9ANNE|nr:unnamed protein product [Dimorphilus gyrociliatus]
MDNGKDFRSTHEKNMQLYRDNLDLLRRLDIDMSYNKSMSANSRPVTSKARKSAKSSERKKRESPKNLETVATNFLERTDRIENENVTLRQDNERLLSSMNKIIEENKSNDDELHRLKSENAELIEKCEELKEDNQALKIQLNDSSNSKSDRVTNLEESHDELQLEIERLQNQLSKEQSENESLTQKIRETMKSNKQELIRKEEEIENLKRDKRRLNEKVGDLQEEIDNYHSDSKKSSNELQEELEGLRMDLKEGVQKLKTLKGDYNNLEEKYERLKGERSKDFMAEFETDERIQDLEKELRISNQKYKDLNEDYESMKDKYKNLKTKKEKSASAEIEISSAKENYQRVLEEKQNVIIKLEELKDEKIKLNSDYEKLKLLNDEGKRQLEALEASTLNLTNSLSVKNRQISDLRKELEMSQSDIQQSRNERISLDSLQSQLEDIQSAHRKLIDDNRRLKNELNQKKMLHVQSSNVGSDFERELQSTRAKLKKADNRIIELESWLDEIYSTDVLTNRTSPSSLPSLTSRGKEPMILENGFRRYYSLGGKEGYRYRFIKSKRTTDLTSK